MLYRSITERIEQFFEKEKKAALMVTGARQVGKTYCIREYAKQHFKYVIEINFLEMPQDGLCGGGPPEEILCGYP